MPPSTSSHPGIQQKGIVRARATLGSPRSRTAVADPDVMAIDFRRAWSTESAGTAVRAAPRYERFAYAIRHVVRVLHAIAAMGRAEGRGVRIYIGRTAADEDSVAARFRVHSDASGRGHECGAVLFRALTSAVVEWEGRLNRALEVLADRGGMKVANRAGDARGPVTPRRSSVVYVTWEFIDGRKVRATTRADVGAIVRALARADDELSRDTAEHAFEGLTEPDDIGTIGFVRGDGGREAAGGYSLGKSAPRRVAGGATPRR